MGLGVNSEEYVSVVLGGIVSIDAGDDEIGTSDERGP